jgi:LytS/YehU family sensor histidine kinase
MTIRNAGDQPAQQTERRGFGLGLESTRERLAHLYGSDRFGLDIDTLGNETTARIRIPYGVAAL